MNIGRSVMYGGIALALLLSRSAATDEVRVLTWQELMPEGETVQQPIIPNPHSPGGGLDDKDWAEDTLEDMFSQPIFPSGVVEELNGLDVKLPGFVVALEITDDGKVSEFLLVPYFGACIHYPPPPPNQIVYVSVEDPIDVEMTWGPIWATGELTTDFRNSELGSAGYTMAASSIEEYDY